MDITNKIDKYVDEEDFQKDLDEGIKDKLIKSKNKIIKGKDKIKDFDWRKATNKVKNYDYRGAKNNFMKNFRIFKDFVQKAGLEDEVLEIINKQLGTRFTSLDDIADLEILAEGNINEADSISDWWEEKSSKLWKNISLSPFHKAMGELTKLMRGSGGSVMMATGYTLLWIMIATGKIVGGKLKTAAGK